MAEGKATSSDAELFSDRPEVRAAKIETLRLVAEGEKVAEEAGQHHEELRTWLEALRGYGRYG